MDEYILMKMKNNDKIKMCDKLSSKYNELNHYKVCDIQYQGCDADIVNDVTNEIYSFYNFELYKHPKNDCWIITRFNIFDETIKLVIRKENDLHCVFTNSRCNPNHILDIDLIELKEKYGDVIDDCISQADTYDSWDGVSYYLETFPSIKFTDDELDLWCLWCYNR